MGDRAPDLTGEQRREVYARRSRAAAQGRLSGLLGDDLRFSSLAQSESCLAAIRAHLDDLEPDKSIDDIVALVAAAKLPQSVMLFLRDADVTGALLIDLEEVPRTLAALVIAEEEVIICSLDGRDGVVCGTDDSSDLLYGRVWTSYDT